MVVCTCCEVNGQKLIKDYGPAGAAVGAGWQFLVSMINIGCCYVVGLPIGALLGYEFKLGIQGIGWATVSA